MTHEIAPNEFFKWQGAYGAFTVSRDRVKSVTDYINNQKTHHAARSLIEDWERCEIEEGPSDCPTGIPLGKSRQQKREADLHRLEMEFDFQTCEGRFREVVGAVSNRRRAAGNGNEI
jgi:hypothetical protein